MSSLQLNQFSPLRQYHPVFIPVTAHFMPGKFYHIRGENGVGKSTLLKSLAGLYDSYEGQFSSEFLLDEIMYFYDVPILRDDWTVLEGLEFYAKIDGVSLTRDILDELMVQLKLNHIFQKKMSQISLGQLKRIYMARLIYKNTAKLWLLDEPVSSLDITGVKILNHLIHVYLKRGGMVIATGHHTQFEHVNETIDLKSGLL